MAETDPLRVVAVDLYALPPAEFTKARNGQAADARAAGDRELAERIRLLTKPSASAWAVNMLSRHHADQVSQLIELGAALRQAQSGLDAEELRELGRQRQKLIAAVVGQARALAEELGAPISTAAADEVGQTLQAALSDPGAAEAVAAGLLTRPLAASGWGPVDIDGAVAVPTGKEGNAQVTDISERQLAKAKRRLKEAEQLLEERESEAEELDQKLRQLVPQRQRMTGLLDDLKARIDQLHGELAVVDREAERLTKQRNKVAAAVDTAALEVDDAAEQVKKLT